MSVSSENSWLARYRQMAKRMYEIRRRVAHLGILGISTLHPRYPIPEDHLELMKVLEGVEKGHKVFTPSIFALFAQWRRSLLYACRECIAIAYGKIRFGSLLRRRKSEPTDLVIKSWCFGGGPLNGSGDFYYGTLGEKLRERGIRSVFLLGDARGRMSKQTLQGFLRNENISIVPEELLLPIWAPFVVVWKQLVGSLKIRRLVKHTTDPQWAAVCTHASTHGVKPSALRHGLYFYIAREAVRNWHPRALVTLYEGQPWEKLAWHGAKAADPKCRIVGYQHTVVMPHALSLLSPNQFSWEMSVPETILCLGETTQKMLMPGHAPFGTPLIPFGSFRHPGGTGVGSQPDPRRRTVLVLPVGVLDEAVVLFRFAMELAGRLPSHWFIFRCHPVLPFRQVRPHLSNGPEALGNIEISAKQEIGEDFERSSSVLYHGSSAILYALLHGLKPIYLATPDLPDTDPLFELTCWREKISSQDQAQALLESYAATPLERVRQEWEEAFRYAQKYTKPVDDQSIEAFLESIGMSRGPLS